MADSCDEHPDIANPGDETTTPGNYVPPYTVDDEDADDGDNSSSSSADEGPVTFEFDELADLCSEVGLSPDMITGVLVQLITQHFSCADWIIKPELREYVWTPDVSTRKIFVYGFASYVASTQSNKLPAIVYRDMGQQGQRVAIGDQFYNDKSRPEANGYARFWRGSHRLMCIGQTDGEASLLASELAQWFTEFQPWITSALPFHDFQVVSRSGEQPFEQLGGRVGVALNLSYTYLWAWELVPDGPPLKAITITKNT